MNVLNAIMLSMMVNRVTLFMEVHYIGYTFRPILLNVYNGIS